MVPTIDEASNSVGGKAESARELSTGIMQSKSTLESLSNAFAALGANDKQGEAEICAGEAETLAAQANALTDTLDALRSRIEGLRGLLATGGDVTRSTPGVSASRPVFDHAARDGDRSAAIQRFGWPKNSKGRTSARGLLYDSSGNLVLRQPLRALRKGLAYSAPELKEPWRSDPEMKTTWHIEGGVAAYMRKTQTRVMSL